MSIRDEFGRRVSDDELCAEVRQAVEDGDEDTLRRLGFGGFGGYVQRLSELMNESVRDELDYSPDFGALMSQVASPVRYAHHLVTESGTAVQTAKDTPLGIHVKPLEPEFDDDALKGTVGTAASMDDPERAVGNLADGLAYAVKKAGNDFIKANAEQRSRAGFEVKVKRSGSTKCCPWCAARIGSWAIANAPDGVFGCHANCSCTVEYTSSTGAKTSARGANLHRFGAGAFVEAEYQPPHVLSREEAREKGGFDKPKRLTKNPVESQPHRLTGGENGGILNYRDSGGSLFSITEQAVKTMPSVGFLSGEAALKYDAECQNLLTYAMNSGYDTGTEFSIILDENMNRIDGHGYVNGQKGSTPIDDYHKPYHALHNHGSDETLSIRDLSNFLRRKNQKSITAIGNRGSRYVLSETDKIQSARYYVYVVDQSNRVFFTTSQGVGLKIKDFTDETRKVRTSPLVNGLPETEIEEIKKALANKTREILIGGEKYGYKYYEKRASD